MTAQHLRVLTAARCGGTHLKSQLKKGRGKYVSWARGQFGLQNDFQASQGCVGRPCLHKEKEHLLVHQRTVVQVLAPTSSYSQMPLLNEVLNFIPINVSLMFYNGRFNYLNCMFLIPFQCFFLRMCAYAWVCVCVPHSCRSSEEGIRSLGTGVYRQLWATM